MKVYALKAQGNYGGGMAIVAAESEAEAKMTALSIRDAVWNTNYGTPEIVEPLPCICKGPARVLVHFETGE